jgi:hypothetical protein
MPRLCPQRLLSPSTLSAHSQLRIDPSKMHPRMRGAGQMVLRVHKSTEGGSGCRMVRDVWRETGGSEGGWRMGTCLVVSVAVG